MGPELVLRDVPGKFRKRRRESQRLWRRFGTLASLYSARRKVVRIPADPGSLRPPVPLFAAGWVFAGALSLSDSWVRYKPSPADTARFLPNIGHGPHLQHEVACPETNFQSWGPPRQRLLTGTTVTEALSVELEQEEDGRWIAEVRELPGVLAYGKSAEDARARAQALALRVVADRLEHGEAGPDLLSISFKAA